MNKATQRQIPAGIAALSIAVIYTLGFIIFFTVLKTENSELTTTNVQYLIANYKWLFVAIFILYIVSGLILIILIQAIHERIKFSLPILSQFSYVIGLIWSAFLLAAGSIYLVGMDVVIELYKNNPDQAKSSWVSMNILFEALGGGTEIIGGFWILLISLANLKLRIHTKALNYSGLVLGVVGIVSILPPLKELTAIFGLGSIIWFTSLGLILILKNESDPFK